MLLLPFLMIQNLWAQEVSYSAISSIIEVGTVAVAFASPRSQLILGGQLATTENISLLANVKTICVLPYNGWQAKSVIGALPSLSLIQSGLETDKALRQLRNEVSEEISKKGFQSVDCLAGNEPDAELLFTKVLGGFGFVGGDLPDYFWLLYANERHNIRVHGENELLGLARPASGWLPLSSESLAEQLWSVVDAAQAILPGSGVKRVTSLADVTTICVAGSQEVRSEALRVSQTMGLQVSECSSPFGKGDARLEISQSVISPWSFALIIRGGGALDIYSSQARSIEAGMKDLSKALKKSNRR
jgi:hypothetical protein